MSENRSQKSNSLSHKTASLKDITKQENDNKKEDDPERKIKLGQIVSLMKAMDKIKKEKEQNTQTQSQEINQTEQSNNQITKTENKSTLSSSVYQDSINKEYMNAVEQLSKNIKKYYPKKGRLFQPKDNLVQCWKCNCLNLVNPEWEYIECADCRTLCKIPRELTNKEQYDLTSSKKVPALKTVITCPKCKASNKCWASDKEMSCIVCRNKFEIVPPDPNPSEEECDSLNPHSRYYKFRYKHPPEYPPLGAYGVSDMFFPDPMMVNWMPLNPYVNYNAPYQELKTFERSKKISDVHNRIKKEYFGKSKLSDPDKVYLMDKLKELDTRASNAIKEGMNNRYYIYQQMGMKGNESKNYIDKLNQDKVECYKKMFFLK